MLQNLSVGPPMVGATDLKSSPDRTGRGFKGSESGAAFGKALEEKVISRSPQTNKEDSSPRLKDPNRSEKSAEKIKEPAVAKPEARVAKKATVRQQAIQEFMDSFESEFKVPPTRLVEAMAELTDTQLMQAPEDTAQAVVAQLGLNDEDTQKAQAMYASLLVRLSEVAPQPKAVPEFGVGVGLSHQNTQARVMAAQDRQDLMGASVDRITERFWGTKAGTPKIPLQNLEIDAASFEAVPEVSPEILEQIRPHMEEQVKALPPHLQGQMQESVAPELLTELAQQKASEDDLDLREEFQEVAERPYEVNRASQGASLLSKASVTQDELSQESEMSQKGFEAPQPQGKSVAARVQDFESSLSEKLHEFKHKLSSMESVHSTPLKGEALRSEFAAMPTPAMAAAPVNPAEQAAAVKEIMDKAQYLVNKGGGEMKVEMSPEGMGTIHLKVMLQDGKVNMQMSAESVDAKKAIESSLAELKTSLAAHKLSMENVKVDVVNSTSTDTATQNQTNLNNGQGQHRETRQFWNQFNENFGSQGRRDSLMEMPSLKGYGRSRDPLQPIETRQAARKVEGKGNGLNLVA